jgi:hypothetical protein
VAAPGHPAEADRPVPLPDDAAPIAVARYQLANGLTVELARAPSAALADARLVDPVGRAHADAAAPLVPDAAAWLLDFDAEGWIDNRAEYDRMMWALDVDTMQDARVDSTSTTFQVQGLANYADWHVWRLSALLDRGRYNQVALDALHRVARAIDDDEVKADARRATIERTFRERLFGAGHPLAAPARRLGPALAAVTAGQLTAWKRAHYRPRGATLIISGKFDEAAMRREVDELFAPWADAAPAPLPAMPPVQPAPTASWLAVEDRDALQVAATVAFPLAPTADRGPARQIASDPTTRCATCASSWAPATASPRVTSAASPPAARWWSAAGWPRRWPAPGSRACWRSSTSCARIPRWSAPPSCARAAPWWRA